jgi:cyclophilin family peptidyl-prolyl cis-trans isomerase
LAYVNSGFYDNTVFHRHARQADLSTFVMQGGGYTAPLVATATNPAPKTTRAPIVLERGLSNLRYTLAMARTGVLNSATSEFFINTVDNAFLDTSSGGYAAFGTITEGMALVDRMVAAPCATSSLNFGAGSPDCLPVPNLVITRAVQTR